MRLYRSLVGYAFAALAMCIPGWGYASALEKPDVITALRFAVADVGHYGGESAKAEIEMAYMVSLDSVSSGVGEGLVKMSNGFVQKTLTIREVAEGTSGSTASTQLS